MAYYKNLEGMYIHEVKEIWKECTYMKLKKFKSSRYLLFFKTQTITCEKKKKKIVFRIV